MIFPNEKCISQNFCHFHLLEKIYLTYKSHVILSTKLSVTGTNREAKRLSGALSYVCKFICLTEFFLLCGYSMVNSTRTKNRKVTCTRWLDICQSAGCAKFGYLQRSETGPERRPGHILRYKVYRHPLRHLALRLFGPETVEQ